MGEAPKLELEVPVLCVSDYVRLLRGRVGMRKDDEGPLTVENFNVFHERGFVSSDELLPLLVRVHDAELRHIGFLFHAVELRVMGTRQENGIVTSVRVGAVVRQDISREFFPVVGQAGSLVDFPLKKSAGGSFAANIAAPSPVLKPAP
jgi:hypothetical protein